HVGYYAGVFAVAGLAQAGGSAPHHRVLVGEGINGPVLANTGLYLRRVASELAAGHRVGNELAQQVVGVGRRGSGGASQVQMSQKIHRVRAGRWASAELVTGKLETSSAVSTGRLPSHALRSARGFIFF